LCEKKTGHRANPSQNTSSLLVYQFWYKKMIQDLPIVRRRLNKRTLAIGTELVSTAPIAKDVSHRPLMNESVDVKVFRLIFLLQWLQYSCTVLYCIHLLGLNFSSKWKNMFSMLLLDKFSLLGINFEVWFVGNELCQDRLENNRNKNQWIPV